MSEPHDLAAEVFTAVVTTFYDESGAPRPFHLLPKADVQDDPFDRYVIGALQDRLPSGMKVLTSGRLVSPDLVVARPEETRVLIEGGRDLDERRIIAVEIKKLKPTPSGGSARASGLDYNSTPPCAVVTVTSADGSPLRIPAFYMFALLSAAGEEQTPTALALVTGAALNQDRSIYDAATGQRQKNIGLGTYGDGLDRVRPMFVFSNPLGWTWMLEEPTLLHERDDLEGEQPSLVRVREVERIERDSAGLEIARHTFWAYRVRRAEREYSRLDKVTEPFPVPANRSTATNARGKFSVDLRDDAMRLP